MSDYNQPGGGCPFDYRLARTPYLVLPKLALQSMPMEWRRRFEAMLEEMDATGLSTPCYHVLRDDGQGKEYTRARVVNEESGFVRITRGKDDPWANYRYGDAESLCPDFVRIVSESVEPRQRRPSPQHLWVSSWDGEGGYWVDAIGATVRCIAPGYEDRTGIVREHSPAHDTFGIEEYPGDPTFLWMGRGGLRYVHNP